MEFEMPWPKIFQDESLIETTDIKNLCSQALTAWAMVYGQLGVLPSNFGEVMAEVANKVGVTGTADSFSDYARE